MSRADVGLKLEALAICVLDAAMAADVPLSVRIDVFKAVTQYHVGMKRVGKNDDDPSEGATFDEFTSRITAASGGGTGGAASAAS